MTGIVADYNEQTNRGVILSGPDRNRYELRLADFSVGRVFTFFPMKTDLVEFDIHPENPRRAVGVRRLRDLLAEEPEPPFDPAALGRRQAAYEKRLAATAKSNAVGAAQRKAAREQRASQRGRKRQIPKIWYPESAFHGH